MTKEQYVFLQILADHLNRQKTIIEDPNINWDIIIKYARSHQVSGIVYSQAKDFLPAEQSVDLHQEILNILYLKVNRDNDLKSIEDLWIEKHIPYFVIKGSTVANLYPVPELRTMGDTDIVVHSKDRERSNGLLRQLGFECTSQLLNREWQYYKNNLEYELHDRLVYDEAVNKPGQAEFFNDCWKYVRNGELDWNFHLLFLIFHLSKHLLNSGVGFRQFMDLAVVIQQKQLDWEWIENKLVETQMKTFAQKCFGLICCWFGLRTPIALAIDEDFYEYSTGQIFNNGVFGYCDKKTTITNEVRHNRYPHLKMFALLIMKVFPPISELKMAQQYAYLNKTRVLLPYAWIHRWCRGIKSKKLSSLMRIIPNSFTSNDAIKKRNNTLDQWGL